MDNTVMYLELLRDASASAYWYELHKHFYDPRINALLLWNIIVVFFIAIPQVHHLKSIMNIAFAIAANGVHSLYHSYRTLREEWDKVDPYRIAALVDLDNCFFHGGIRSLGFTGGSYLLHYERITKILQKNIDQGMLLVDIPGSLAKTRTYDVLRSRAAGRIVVREEGRCQLIDDDIVAVEFEKEIQKDSSRLQAVYIGDWLDVVNSVISMTARMNVDLVIGNKDKMTQIIRNFQQLEDYSEFNIHRKPPGGQHKNEDKPSDAVPSPILVPIRLRP